MFGCFLGQSHFLIQFDLSGVSLLDLAQVRGSLLAEDA